MDGTQTLIAILSATIIAALIWSWKIWLQAQSRDKKCEFDATAREQETERYRIVADIVKQTTQSHGGT